MGVTDGGLENGRVSLPVFEPRAKGPLPAALDLRPGEWIEVRSEAEILETLDENGTLEGMPFMAEMRQFCGGRYQVKARADRSIASKAGLRRLDGVVHLDGVRCDGAEHDGCARTCLLFWKEAWLRRPAKATFIGRGQNPRGPVLKTRDGERYFCQATELARASTPLSPRAIGTLFAAREREGLSYGDIGRALAIRVHDLVKARIGGDEWNMLRGPCTDETPAVVLGLVPGERVRVKSKREILATLDANGWNRRMEFSREMLRYCGGEFVVARRVDRIITDHTGRMVKIGNTVILEGLVYKDLIRMGTPRGEYMFWRECWLERVPTGAAARARR